MATLTDLTMIRYKAAEVRNAQAALERAVCRAYQGGNLQREIADAAGVSQQRISQILEANGIRGKGGIYAQRRARQTTD